MDKKKKKVLVAMSGGVDSSTTVLLLKEQGHDVVGAFMNLGVNQEEAQNTARRVCQYLNIKFYPINFARQFKKEIIEYFLNSYSLGLTPNPCVKCNQLIKFGELLRKASSLNCDYLATGHYANVELRIMNEECDSGQNAIHQQAEKNAKFIYKLFRGKDKGKDQSYFLYNLKQEQLRNILFPLGEYTKEEVRKIANQAGLPYLKKESQDVCFLSGDHNDFLRKHIKLKPGLIKVILPRVKEGVRREFKVVGQHQGLPLYTIGQRKGIEIGGVGPFYVLKADYKTNILYVASNANDPNLYRDNLIASQVSWIVGVKPKLPLKCQAVIRYRHQPVDCVIKKKKTGKALIVQFKKPQRAITPGQSVVFYKGEEVLGGGVIGGSEL
ncbi:MAG: tRNA 2-thiouridine(34) synthase MnmA [Patescibacteria group bacterium]